jgi:hypothetical protein
MLTLKVITTDIDGQKGTHLFNCDHLTHRERESNDYQLKFANDEKVYVIGYLPDKESKQKFTYSDIWLYDGGNEPKMLIYALPRSECFVMNNGKTVDSFGAYFE